MVISGMFSLPCVAISGICPITVWPYQEYSPPLRCHIGHIPSNLLLSGPKALEALWGVAMQTILAPCVAMQVFELDTTSD